MIVKNISEDSHYFQFGPRVRGFNLAAGAQKFVPDSEVALNFAQTYVAAGILAIVGGPAITTVLTPAVIPAALPIIFTGAVIAGNTVTIDGVVFTFRAAADGAATTVVIGLTDAASAAALATAVNTYPGTGFEVRAQAGATIGGDPAVILYSKKPGTKGNGAYNATTGTGHTITKVGTNLTASTNPAGGRDSSTVKVVTFADTLIEEFTHPYQVFTGLSEITNVQLTVFSETGVLKTITDPVTYAAGVVQITEHDDVAAVNLTAGDIIHLTVTGK